MYRGNFKYMINSSCCSDVIEYLINAEESLYRDPVISTICMLSYCEIIVKKIYNQYSLGFDINWDLKNMLDNDAFSNLVNREILKLFKYIDDKGMYLIYYDEDLLDDIKEQEALELLKAINIIAYWFYKSFRIGEHILEEFIPPVQFYFGCDDESIKHVYKEYRKIRFTMTYKLPKYIKMTQSDFIIQNNEVAKSLGFKKDFIFLNDVFSGVELTNSQKNAIDKLDLFLNDSDEKIFVLKGFGGTGKTFLTKGITDYFELREINYILAAPTGKAAKVIQNKTLKSATTIHKAIYSFRDLQDESKEKNEDTYKIFFNIDEHSVQPSNTVFIFDEASMIGDNYQKNEFYKFGSAKLLSDLFQFTNIFDKKFNNKIIFIGDTAQLPPIGMKTSPALDINYLYDKLQINVKSTELTDVVRQQKQSGILLNSINLRKQMLNKNFQNGASLDLNYDDINEIKESDLISEYIKSCNGQISDNSIIIASKNELVDNYNSLVRDYFFPNKKYITEDDKVMAIENYRDPNFPIFNGDYGYVKVVYDDIIQRDIAVRTTIENESITVTVPLRFKRVQIEFIGINNPFTIDALIFENILYRNKIYANSSFENDIKRYVLSDSDIAAIEKKALYLDVANRAEMLGIKDDKKKFRKFMAEDPYYNALKVKFGYAITCHKAQGSEWENVFLNCNYHNKYSLDYLRWLYTAITRSTKKLYLINSPIG
jgi:hypothetical protein